jgi:arylsulfatase
MMTNRFILATFIFSVFVFVFDLTAAERPNIILILADDLGYSDLGCYGGEIKTPNLDALASGGLRFTQFYNTTRCCPSRASINTGLYPHQAGIGLMDGHSERRGYEGYLTDRCVTIAEVLKQSGYRTYMSGKWHMGNKSGPLRRGFDEYFGLIGGFTSFFKPEIHTRLPAGKPLREYKIGEYYATDVFTDYALDFLAESRKVNENGERPPFYLYLAYTAPHFPLHALKEDIAKYADVYAKGWDMVRQERFARQQQLGVLNNSVQLTPRSEVPKNWANEKTGWANKENPTWETIDADRRADLARRMAIFAAMIDRMDWNIGRVIANLKEHGDFENTLILFLSDNGACAEWDPWGFDINSGPQNILHKGEELENMGGPGTYHSTGSGWANVSNTPWRLYKHYIHEGGIRTPLIAHWSKGIARKGEFEKSVGHIIDFMPTFVELAGAEYPQEVNGKPIIPMEGRSLLEAFYGKQQQGRTLFWEHENNRGVREKDWKAVWVNSYKVWELYDLKTDPMELNNLAEKQPETLKRLVEAWEQWAKRTFVRGL